MASAVRGHRLAHRAAGAAPISRTVAARLPQHGLRCSQPAERKHDDRRCAAAQPDVAQAQTVVDDFRTDTRPVILFDGVCNLCNGAVNFMLDNDPQASFRMAALQSPAGKRLLARSGRRPDDISSIVLVEQGEHHIKSEAVLRIASRIGNPWPLLALFGLAVPPFARDVAYDAVANNRYSILGRRDVCRLSEPGFESRFITE